MSEFVEVRNSADVDAKAPLVASTSMWQGQWRLDIRFLYMHYDSGEWRPSKKGISVPIIDGVPLLESVIKTLNEAEPDAEEELILLSKDRDGPMAMGPDGTMYELVEVPE